MKTIGNLVKRNMLLYFRDKTAVFFSLLSMLIVIGLMVVFLGSMNVDNIIDLLKQYGGARDVATDKENAKLLVVLWTVSGIIVVNAFTVTLTIVGMMVQDEENGKLASFYVAPIDRAKILFGYIISAVIIGVIICMFTFFISELYILAIGGELLGVVATLKIFGLIVLNVFVSACMMILLASLIHSESAWSALGTIVGTLVGFVGGIYLPMGMLPSAVQNVLKAFPVLHGTSMMREIFTHDAIAKTFSGQASVMIPEYKDVMGISILVNDKVLNSSFQMIFVLLCGILFLGVATLLLKKRAIRDR